MTTERSGTFRRDRSGRPLAWGGFGGFEEFIRQQGGIVTRAELLDAGWTPDELRIATGSFRRPTRLRHGWYCSTDVPDIVRRAWACGGPLACWSALGWYADHGSETARTAIGDRSPTSHNSASTIHISVESRGHARRVELDPPPLIVRHSLTTADSPRARWAVPVDVALRQTRYCTG
ncbi:hypothetical protein OVN18_03340 [Microcella daejeonensis]|uniref:Uncharacterized protein n=1 Tax=Microcella daejeonensis TaxID=2994971 RepID=A0A9E8S9Z8_9MICO|nr:hypothetical protein [Microcella daejeonensis]WAB82056.1 hypothetical protein OVN18_03340 [Microcella daejeonensis]